MGLRLGPNAPCMPQSGVDWGCVDPGHRSLDRMGKPLESQPSYYISPTLATRKKEARLCPGHPTTAHPTTRSQPAFLVTCVVSSSHPEPPLLLRSLANYEYIGEYFECWPQPYLSLLAINFVQPHHHYPSSSNSPNASHRLTQHSPTLLGTESGDNSSL